MHHIHRHSFGPVEAHELGFAPIGSPLKTVFFYIIDNIIIDTGPHHLESHIEKIVSGKTISAIFLTHHHEDHSGNAGMLSKKFDAPVYGHPYAKKKLCNGFAILPYQHILFGKAPQTNVTVYPEHYQSKTLSLKPIHTAGHSKDHTVYLDEKNGWLFSGDLFIHTKIHFFRSDEQIGDQICSLKKVLQLDFDSLFCAHQPFPTKGKAKIREKLDFLQSFHGKVGELHQRGYSEKAICAYLKTKSDSAVKLFTMGNASFAHMVKSSIRAHLQAQPN